MAFRPKPPPRVKQGPSELDDLTKTFQNLYSNPLPNLSLFLSCLAILFFMRPSHALIIGGLTICIGLYGRNSVELNPSGADKEQKKAKSLEIKKFDAAITVSSIAIALALLLSWFGR
ncbi:hypothetical protein LOC67_00930 [Stieleria sp. JC731]|nr:hypothetical protein [Stieleria sp. JC731]MCC9599104.1 hypothetical protein [Stieleria sp. JC731]